MKKFIIYFFVFLYFIFFSIFCFLYTFPYKKFSSYLTLYIDQNIYKSIDINSIKYNFPFDFIVYWKFSELNKYIYLDKYISTNISFNIFNIQKISIITKLTQDKNIYTDIHLDNLFTRPYIKNLKVEINKLKLKSIPIQQASIDITGDLQGTLSIYQTTKQNYNFNLHAQGLKLLVPLTSSNKEIPISSIDVKGKIKGVTINMESIHIKSRYLQIQGNGNISLNPILRKSRLSIRGKLVLNPLNIRKEFNMFSLKINPNYRYYLYGTLNTIKYKVY